MSLSTFVYTQSIIARTRYRAATDKPKIKSKVARRSHERSAPSFYPSRRKDDTKRGETFLAAWPAARDREDSERQLDIARRTVEEVRKILSRSSVTIGDYRRRKLHAI